MLGVFALYAAVRFWRLTSSCLWFDEIFSVHAAEHSWDTILNFISLDLIHPPLFYVLLKVWIAMAGDGLFWLRLLPVLFSIITVVPFLGLCRELKLGFWTQILALFFLAINGALIKYAQEVRMYSLLLCLAVFSMWIFCRWLNRGKSFLALVLVNILAVYTHYFGWFIVAAEISAILILQRSKWRHAGSILATTAGFFAPWAYAVAHAAVNGSQLAQNIGWITRPGFRAAIDFALDVVEPFYYQMSSAEATSTFFISLPILIVALVSLASFATSRNRIDGLSKENATLLALFGGPPILVALIGSWILPYSIWGTRHLIIVFIPLLVALSMSIAALKPMSVRRLALATLAVCFGLSLFFYWMRGGVADLSWCRWETMLTELGASENVYASEDLIAYHVWFSKRNTGIKIFNVKAHDGVRGDDAYFLPRGFEGVKTIEISDIDENRVLLAYRASEMNENEPPLRALKARGYEVKNSKQITVNDDGTIIALLER